MVRCGCCGVCARCKWSGVCVSGGSGSALVGLEERVTEVSQAGRTLSLRKVKPACDTCPIFWNSLFLRTYDWVAAISMAAMLDSCLPRDLRNVSAPGAERPMQRVSNVEDKQ